MSETDLMQRVRLKATELGWRLFRNNVGQGWFGRPCNGCSHRLTPIRFGLCVGSSDLVGWKPVKVTPEMVGHTIALFTAIEIKAPKGHTTVEQDAFLNAVATAGGDARVVRFESQL